MKKIIYISALIASAFAISSCNHEYDFPGIEEGARPTNVAKYEVVYNGGEFSPEKPAKNTIPDWLFGKYSSCDKGSTAMVEYKFKEPITSILYREELERQIIQGTKTAIVGWLNIVDKGEKFWNDGNYSNSNYTQFSANKTGVVCSAWLISPKFSIKKGMSFTFDVAVGYYNASCLKVMISTDFTGNMAKATWKDVTAKFDVPTEPTSKIGSQVSAGEFLLDEYANKTVCFAFKYDGDDSTAEKKTTTYQLDNFTLSTPGEKIANYTDEYTFTSYEKKWEFVRTVPKYLLSETFERTPITNFDKTMLTGWLNHSATGEKFWYDKIFSGNTYTEMTANKAVGACEAWLVTPGFTIVEDNISLSFDVCIGYYKASCLSVLISTDFDGTVENISTATWTDLSESFSIPQEPTGTYGKFGPAGKVSLKDFVGKKAYVAFKYVGNGTTSATTTYQIDNVLIGE